MSALAPLTNRNFKNSNLDELVMHMGASRRNLSSRAFFKTVAFDRNLGMIMVGYSHSTDYFVYFPNSQTFDTTGVYFPVKTMALKQKLADIIKRDLEFWYTQFPESLDIPRDLHMVGLSEENTLIMHYAPQDIHIFATVGSDLSITFDRETLIIVPPVTLNILTKYLQIPGLLQSLQFNDTKRSKMVVNKMNIKSLFLNNNNNNNQRTILSLMYKNQPMSFNTRNQRLIVPRNNTLGLTNVDRVVLEKYVKEHYVYNPDTRRIVNSSVKSFKPVLSRPNLTAEDLQLLSAFNNKYNGKRMMVSQGTAVFNGGSLNNNTPNSVQRLQAALSAIIDSALPKGSDRRGYWNGNYNVIFRHNVTQDYTLYQDWHRDMDKQYNQSMFAFVIFFIEGDDRYNGGELVCVRPRANQTVNKSNLVSCNPSAASGQAVVLHAATGYHKVMPYVIENNNSNKNGIIKRNMLLVQLFTNRYMLNEQNMSVGSVKQYAHPNLKRRLNQVL